MTNYALITVYDKSNLKKICSIFKKYKIKIISSGTTGNYIRKLGFKCDDLSKYTKFKEILDGRVKTLHPKIHASILFKRQNKKHSKTFKKLNFPKISFLIVNLYPFKEFVKLSKDHEKCIEMIDIGGTALLRSGAKNYSSVTTIASSKNYDQLISNMKKNMGSTSLNFRHKMALKTFELTSQYDSKISNWFSKSLASKKNLPKNRYDLKYGENPNQNAYYLSKAKNNFITKTKITDQKLSYNNLLDIDSAINLINEFKDPTCIIIKHNNPCGAATAKNINIAYRKALESDPKSAFGGIVILNRNVNSILSKKINEKFFEIVIAKSFDKNSLVNLKNKKRLILINLNKFNLKQRKEMRSVLGGKLVQQKNLSKIHFNNFKLVSNKKASKTKINDLVFALKICKHTKSNSIVLAKNNQLIGVGAGQTSRIDSVKVSLMKFKSIKRNIKNFVAASDAFFPFNDSIKLLINNGCDTIVQPAGSKNDNNAISYSNKRNISLYFTTERFFKH